MKMIALYNLKNDNKYITIVMGKKYELKTDEQGDYVIDDLGDKYYLSQEKINLKFYTVS